MGESEETHRFESILDEFQSLVNVRLQKVLRSSKPAILYGPIEYVLAGGGKRIRPALLILSCRALNGDIDLCWDAAVAIELLHNFTLVHDDIMDQDSTRRGRPTVHKKWNSDIALLAGDGLFGLAYQSLLRTPSPRLHEIAKAFTDGVVEICEGQALDLEFESRQDVSLEDYLSMIGKKTARLLYVSAKLGAMIGEGSPVQVEALAKFAFRLGSAFQIQDDLLDITCDEDVLGKTFGSDVIRRKQTYLLVHAMNHADTETRRKLNNILGNQSIQQSDIMAVKNIFESTGSFDAAYRTITEHLNSAREYLDEIPPSAGKEDLRSLLSFISNRRA